ncbi:MAG: EcsC family protein, partial [Roseiarcus sp.]
LKVALRFALRTIDKKSPAKAARGMHKAAAAASGAVGGAFGLASVAIELPISTTILLRSIAEIAREEGEDLSRSESALACVEVFALGAEAPGEAAIESGYFAVRGALAKSVSESARFIVQRGVADQAAPILVRFISQIAARFGVVVGEKLAAQAVPVFGAIGGAAVNVAFADHFQTVARGHFIVRRLERTHGADAVQFEYRRLRNRA